jgi:hypothetical protein
VVNLSVLRTTHNTISPHCVTATPTRILAGPLTLFPANQSTGFGAVQRARLVVIPKPDPMGKLPIQAVNADSHLKESRKIQ